MDDPILASYLKEFTTAFNLHSLGESELFEYFSAYCAYFRDFSERTDLEDVVVSGGKDTGIDAVGMFINDVYVDSSIQIDEIASKVRLDADFAFIQAKTSRHLNAAEIGSFIQGVREFFSQPFMPANEDIASKRTLSDRIFTYSVRMRGKPKLHLFYCYVGTFQSDETITARVDAGKADLKRLNLFSEIEFSFLDANSLQERYQEINLRVEKEIQIDEYANLPAISGIRQSYLGVLRCSELVKLLSNSDGRLQKSLFNENVRDFLSRNPVNDEISQTIRSKSKQSRLVAFNNGITIVARGIRIVGKKFTLSDFQIVNGCQTSHIIFMNQRSLLSETSVPVKIIEAEDKELVNEIVRATNRQTEVKDEAFEVLKDFHKKSERFFASIEADSDHKLVYERRKRQYAESAYTTQNIVTLSLLTGGFVSCFLENPVASVDYYGVLLDKYSESIFVDGQSLWPYLVSATIWKEIEKLCVGKARRNIWKVRFILALLLRKTYGKVPNLKDDSGQKSYAEKIIKDCHEKKTFPEKLKDAERALAYAIVAQGRDFDSRNAHQDRRFVEKLFSSI
jgi:hypothetical protein